MEVQILSRKLITPSSQTSPHHHSSSQDIKISCIDQLAPQCYVQIIFYYEAGRDNDKGNAARLMQLEKSLSETLSIFHPLAGRYVEEDMSIDCNNEGIEFVEATVSGQLNELLHKEQPDPKLLCRFVAYYPQHSATTPLVSVQANMFRCGGLAIGLSISHVVADAYTFSLFSNAWAEICRSGKGEMETRRPSFDLASVLPPRDLSGFKRFRPRESLLWGKDVLSTVTRMFVFDGKAISRLKGRGDSVSQPSRVQWVTALIWRSLIRVCRARRGYFKPSLMTHAFNLRGKTNLPLAERSCGNLWRLVHAQVTPKEESEIELQEMANLVMESMRNASLESARPSLFGDEVFRVVREAWEEIGEAKDKEEVDVYDFTSWCKMGHYEVDFGWGKPSWVSSTYIPADGYVILMDARDGDGIEAWINLEDEKMRLFEHDRDIVAFTT